MSWSQVDFLFPFFVFFYGILMVFVQETPVLARLAQSRMPDSFSQITSRKTLAWVCFFVGGLWSLQNILFS